MYESTYRYTIGRALVVTKRLAKAKRVMKRIVEGVCTNKLCKEKVKGKCSLKKAKDAVNRQSK